MTSLWCLSSINRLSNPTSLPPAALFGCTLRHGVLEGPPAVPVEVLEHVLGALLEGVLVVDAAGRRVYANEEAARLTGYPSADGPPRGAARGGRRPLRDPRPLRQAARADRPAGPPRARRRATQPDRRPLPGRRTGRSASRRCRSVDDPRRRRARSAYVITVLPRGDRAGDRGRPGRGAVPARRTDDCARSTPLRRARRSGSASGTASCATCASTRPSRGSTSGRPRIMSAARSARSFRSSPTTSRRSPAACSRRARP